MREHLGRKRGAGWVVSSMLFGLAACGPIVSTADISDAETELERARAVQAETYAVYEFTSAEEYLGKAREEWGYSDYRKARDYARRAMAFAKEAYDRALQSPDRGAPAIPGGR